MTKDGTYTIDDVTRLAAEASSGASPTIDLAALTHDRHAHRDPTTLALLAWWILSSPDAGRCHLKLPTVQASIDVLARTGVLFAAARRSIDLVQDGQSMTLNALLAPADGRGAERLPNVNWQAFDDVAKGQRLRAIVDLEDPRRRPPSVIPFNGNRRYDWIDGLGAGGSLDDAEQNRYYGDVDTALYEPISNVHLWSNARHAIAVGAATRGSTAESANRFHIVVFDDGLGIPKGLERKRLAARRRESPDWRPELLKRLEQRDVDPSPDDLETALLWLLVHEAYGNRDIRSTDDGHGLHALGMVAGQWDTKVHVYSTADDSGDGAVIHVTGGKSTIAQEREHLPGVRGTLVHIAIPTTTDARTARADKELAPAIS